MTKYKEMGAVAAQERADFSAYRERSLNNLLWLVKGFTTHCGIPEGQITYLRWNGLTGDEWRYAEPVDGAKWTFPGAICFDEEDDSWHIGLHIALSAAGVTPEDWFSFALCVSEEAGQVMVRAGFVGKPQPLDLSNADECSSFYDEIVGQFSKRLKEPRRKPGQRKAGFDVAPIRHHGVGGEKEPA